MSDSTFEFHLKHPEVTLESHIFQKRVAYNASLEGKKAIYLDMKYWCYFCDVTLGKNNDPYLVTLLARLRELVKSGKAFCPLSNTTFFEIYKNRISEIRHATAQLVDELSGGVAIVHTHARMEMELHQLLFHFGYSIINLAPQKLPWVKLSSFFGSFSQGNIHPDPAQDIALQKTFFDYCWNINMEKMVSTVGGEVIEHTHYSELAGKLNAQNLQHVGELESYEHTFRIEAEGAADAYSIIAATDFNLSSYGLSDSVPLQTRISKLRIVIDKALQNKAYQDILRTEFIRTCLHSKLRWNKTQKFNKNDFEDFEHAAAALGYCDYFFTERSLLYTLVSRPETLDKRFHCQVAYKPSDCMNLLANL